MGTDWSNRAPAASRLVDWIIAHRRVTDDHESDTLRGGAVRLEPVPLPLRVKAGNPFASAAIPGVAVPAFRLDFGDILRDAPAIDTRIPVIGLVCVVTPGRRGERPCQARDGENVKREQTNATRATWWSESHRLTKFDLLCEDTRCARSKQNGQHSLRLQPRKSALVPSAQGAFKQMGRGRPRPRVCPRTGRFSGDAPSPPRVAHFL